MTGHDRGGQPTGPQAAGAALRPARALDAAQYGLGPLLVALFLGFPPALPSNPREVPTAVLAGVLLGGGWILFLRTRRPTGGGWLRPAIGATLLVELAGSCLLPWRVPLSPVFSPWVAGAVGLAAAAFTLWGFASLCRRPARPSKTGQGRT